MIVLGIDVGLTGAIAAISPASVRVFDLPVTPDGTDRRRLDGRALILMIRELVPADREAVAYMEDIRPRPMGNGSKHGNTIHSQGSLMRSRGIVEAVFDVARIRLETVRPQAWKHHFALIKAPKDESLAVAKRLYPDAADDLKRKRDHNRAEAILIAHYAARQAEGVF